MSALTDTGLPVTASLMFLFVVLIAAGPLARWLHRRTVRDRTLMRGPSDWRRLRDALARITGTRP